MCATATTPACCWKRNKNHYMYNFNTFKKMTKKEWGKPEIKTETFVPNAYFANCGAYINGLVCEVYGKYGTTSSDGSYATWATDGYLWHAKPYGGCTTWIDENGTAREEGGGTYSNDLTFIQNGPAAGQTLQEFLKSLSNGAHTEIIVQWSTNRKGDNYIHKGYIEVRGNHS